MIDFEESEDAEPVELPVDGVIDLHTFHPGDVKELLPDYIEACRGKESSRSALFMAKAQAHCVKLFIPY